MMVVPRSGSAMISTAAGPMPIATRRTNPPAVSTSAGRLMTRLATRQTQASLASSLGEYEKPATMIQRRAPLTSVPMPGTSTTRRLSRANTQSGSAKRRQTT